MKRKGDVKRDPTHVRVLRVRELIAQAEIASAVGELDKSCALYHKALDDLEGMVHYNDLKHRIFLALAVLSLHMQAPALAEEYTEKAIKLLDNPEDKDACLRNFNELLHEICPPLEEATDKVIPFRPRDPRYYYRDYDFSPGHKAAVAPLRNRAEARGGLGGATGEQAASQNRVSEGELPAG